MHVPKRVRRLACGQHGSILVQVTANLVAFFGLVGASVLPKFCKAFGRDTAGSAFLEATIVTPFLIFLFFGVFEYSRYFYNQQVVEIGIRDAARYLARGPYFSAVVSEGTNPCVDSTNTQNAQNLAVTGTVDGSGTVRVAGWAPGNVKFKCDNIPNPGTYAGPNPIWLVTVYTKFADPALGFFGLLGVGIPNLSASHTERSFGSG